ncbi:MAG TPA: NAD(P)/FAD-dependent oxidoreductase [Pyrinomonadaceae bacterium]|nr:NAD(P)/FAD-dependent oxidoreductase [Pyrinomonadaceae bacterium]
MRDHYDVVIAGAGPAGSSAAIHLARNGFKVLLVEQKKFPRPKLCGEFISPECQDHFEKLGVARAIICSDSARISETVFYSRRGHHVTVPSSWFGDRMALGLSRAVMDDVLLRRAAEVGVEVVEGANVVGPRINADSVHGLKIKSGMEEQEFHGSLTIDATGRARILARKLDSSPKQKPKLIAFKAHLRNTRVAPGACEIYFYSGGYGGLSSIEAGESNLCFIVSAEQVKRCQSDPERVMREMVMKNPRASYTLGPAMASSEWLSASWEHFGRHSPAPATGLLAIGDAAAFIDPFTGSGMLMALESGELVAEVIARHGEKLARPEALATLAASYADTHRNKFQSRLRICGLLRRAAFRPRLTELGVAVFGASERFRNRVARATRSPAANHRSV